MSAVVIKICTVADAESGKVPEYQNAEDARISHVVILEKGMTSGRTSVTLLSTDEAGHQQMIQMSAAQFEQIAGAVRGAAARFGEMLL